MRRTIRLLGDLGSGQPQRGLEPTNLPITNRLRYRCATGALIAPTQAGQGDSLDAKTG